MTDKTTALEACDLGWALGMVNRGYAAAIDPVFTDFPRGARGYQLLHTVIHKSIRSQTALADYLGVDRTIMPYVIDDLQSAGLVERRDDSSDRRVRIVTATVQGRREYQTLSDRVRDAEKVFFEKLDEVGRTTFVETLSMMAHHSRELLRTRKP